MKHAIDFEFDEREDSPITVPVSIGIASEDGGTYYAVFNNVDFDQLLLVNDWLADNVLPEHILFPNGRVDLKSPEQIRREVIRFIARDTRPEFWGYFADTDWVLFYKTVGGTMLNMPKYYPKFCLDVKQEMVRLGNPPKLPHTGIEHNALDDAIWTLDMVHHVDDLSRKLPTAGSVRIGGSVLNNSIITGSWRVDDAKRCLE